jgi:hypothetical protein
MTVKELIEKLQEMLQDFQVVMSKDSEGNNYSPFASMSLAEYFPESTWSGYILTEEDAEDERQHGSGECEYEADNAVILWPVN